VQPAARWRCDPDCSLHASRPKQPQRLRREAALSALRAYPGGLHVGGGVTPESAGAYLDAGASHVIVTSYVFRGGRLEEDRLNALESVPVDCC
jgi:pentose-5-phosphate-3-epimerase